MVTIPRLVFVGALTLDAIALVDRFPEPDTRHVAREIVYAGGGPAATAAVAAARLGAPAAMVGSVGDDDEGERILGLLGDHDVDTSGVQVVPGRSSGASVVVVEAEHGTRTIWTRPVPSPSITADGPAAGLIDQAEWVHVDHLGWQPVHQYLSELSVERRPRLSVDGGNPIEGFTPAGVDLYVPTVEALARRYGDVAVGQLLTSALSEGAHAVVGTRGAEGAVVAAASDGVQHDVPGHPVEVVSTLGAGDVFHGALLAAITRASTGNTDSALPEAAGYANTAAALSCRGLDGRSAIPSDAEVRAAARAHRGTTTTIVAEEAG